MNVRDGGSYGTFSITPAFTLSTDTWYHVLIAFDGVNDWVHYVDGKMYSRQSLAIANEKVTPMYIGMSNGNFFPFNGYIDQVDNKYRTEFRVDLFGSYTSNQQVFTPNTRKTS